MDIDEFVENSRRESLSRLESRLEEIYQKYSDSVVRDDETDIIDISTLEIVHSNGFLASLPDSSSDVIDSIVPQCLPLTFKRPFCSSFKPSRVTFDVKSTEDNNQERPNQGLLKDLETHVIAKGGLPIEFIYALQSQSDPKYDWLIEDLYYGTNLAPHRFPGVVKQLSASLKPQRPIFDNRTDSDTQRILNQGLLKDLETHVIAKGGLPIEFIYALQSQSDPKYDWLIEDLYYEFIQRPILDNL